MNDCSICYDTLPELTFSCPTNKCNYGLCFDCLKTAFNDASGDNVRFCPFCKMETARPMIESVCGVGAIREVERGLRSQVENDIRKHDQKQIESKKQMVLCKERANQLFHVATEELNMKCPRCCQVFFDYDGCNAVRCGNSSCKAAFCAVCLKDCGNDAHACARTHGDLYNKTLFINARVRREVQTMETILQRYTSTESFEVVELLKMKLEKHLKGSQSSSFIDRRVFLAKCKISIDAAIKFDRLSLLNGDEIGNRLSHSDISPRNAVPNEYRLTLTCRADKISIQLFKQETDNKWKQIPLPDDTKGEQKGIVIDSLKNLRRSLQCCVLAFEGGNSLYQTGMATSSKRKGEPCGPDEIRVDFTKVARDGSLIGEPYSLSALAHEKVIGLNQNQRLLQLKRNIDTTPIEVLMPEPISAYVGSASNDRLFDENDITTLPPDTFNEINDEQKKIANPLSLRIAMECAGPPGTGKTKTITELVRSILKCTTLDIIVLSERNGAIDAIAEKMAVDCFRKGFIGETDVIKDLTLWQDILAFGSSGMGNFSKMFSLEEKIHIHPEILECKKNLAKKEAAFEKLRKNMLETLSTAIEQIRDLPDKANPNRRAHVIAKGTDRYSFDKPNNILQSVKEAMNNITEVLAIQSLVEEDVSSMIKKHSSILEDLIPVRSDEEKKAHPTSWQIEMIGIKCGLKSIQKALSAVLKMDDFHVETIDALKTDVTLCEQNLRSTQTRIAKELRRARVRMATIGSSHRLYPEQTFGLDDDSDDENVELEEREVIVIIDEAGCIPAYELLGLCSLRRKIKSIVCVGDKHQLPPYAPNTKSSKTKTGNRQSFVAEEKISSLLDASVLTGTNAKVMLTTQYRVPKDIASILNARVYSGKYVTAKSAQIPAEGFKFVDVPRPIRRSSYSVSQHDNKKYVNISEIECGIDLLLRLKREGSKSIMILTPYKKQQREFEYKLKNRGLGDQCVLTIDQCQGQEADYVLLSLVQRPTRFLNKNRLNVALSRVRKRLYLIADRNEFKDASKDSNWESSSIAKDLLQLSTNDIDVLSNNNDRDSNRSIYDRLRDLQI